jgi:hypothetical protein
MQRVMSAASILRLMMISVLSGDLKKTLIFALNISTFVELSLTRTVSWVKILNWGQEEGFDPKIYHAKGSGIMISA